MTARLPSDTHFQTDTAVGLASRITSSYGHRAEVGMWTLFLWTSIHRLFGLGVRQAIQLSMEFGAVYELVDRAVHGLYISLQSHYY